MAQVIAQMQTIGIVEGKLSLEKRTKISKGQTRHFVVPKLSTDTSPLEIMAGGARPQYQIEPDEVPALAPVPLVEVLKEDIVEAEVILPPTPQTGAVMKKNPNPPPKFIPV